MTETTNYHLKKPDDTDPTDQRPFNDNSDIIDEELAKRYTKEEIDGQEAVLLGEVTKNTAALTELVDNGAKNLIQNQHSGTTRTVGGVTFTANSDGSVSLSGIATANITSYLIVSSQSIFDEPCVLSGCPSGGSDSTYKLDMLPGGGAGGVLVNDYGTGALIDWTLFTSGTFSVRIRIANGTDTTGLVFKPMICTKAEWDVSRSYRPHVPSNKELAESKIDVGLNAIPSGTTLEAFADSLPLGTHICFYNSANNASDAPVNVHAIVEIHKYSSNTGDMTFNPLSTTYQLNEYRKLLTAGTWRDWVVFTGTSVT